MDTLLQVFNKYTEYGGEELIVDRLSRDDSIMTQLYDSADWIGEGAPPLLAQLRRLYYNKASAQSFLKEYEKSGATVALFHNIYPVGSPSLYHAALQEGIPVVQYIHNFRPFSVGATLWNGSKITEESLRGDYMNEILSGAWQGSVLKSAIFALLLKKLHHQRWLDSVKHWIAISDFMREKFILAGIAPEKITTLRHSWTPMDKAPEYRDEGYYFLMARLVPEKGIKTALEAWGVMEANMGELCPMLYIAGSGSEEGAVKNAVEKSSKIKFVGHVTGDKKSSLIHGCRAMLAPSVWWEPLGLVTYEAYDYCKPMLAAASGGLSETIIDGVTGYLHHPGDPFSLLSSVNKLESLKDQQRHDMGMNGREWLLKNTNVEQWQASFLEIINKVKKEKHHEI